MRSHRGYNPRLLRVTSLCGVECFVTLQGIKPSSSQDVILSGAAEKGARIGKKGNPAAKSKFCGESKVHTAA